jgi:hypothetical protein
MPSYRSLKTGNLIAKPSYTKDPLLAVITGGRFTKPEQLSLERLIDKLLELGIRRLGHGANGRVDWGVGTVIEFEMPTIEVTPYPVIIAEDGPWPAAGNRRNERMLITSRAQHLFAFPGGTGTGNCIRSALSFGMTLWRFIDDDWRSK